MTELYDDCNWVNKNHAYHIGNGSWINAQFLIMQDKFMKKQKEAMYGGSPLFMSSWLQFAQMQDELCTCSHKTFKDLVPNANQNLELPIKPKESKGEMKICLTEKDIDSNALFYPKFTSGQQTAFEKWREGLDWGTRKQTEDNCTGDLILP